MSNPPFRSCSAFLLVIANALVEVGAVPRLRDLRVRPADPALRPLPGSDIRDLGSPTGRLVPSDQLYDPVTGMALQSALPVNVRAA